jgi:hypothetical protein
MNIIPCIGLQVNYFPSFQTLLAVKHAESSEKITCFVAGDAPVAVKRRAVNMSSFKIFPVLLHK